MDGQIRISELQLSIMLTSAFTALGLYVFPRDLIAGAGYQIYPPLIGAALTAAVPVVLLVRLYLHFPDQTPFQYVQTILGRPLGLLAGLAYVVLYTGIAAASLRQFGDLVNSIFLPQTPIEITMLLVVAVVININWNGLEAVSRFINLVYPIVLTLALLTFVLSLTRVTEGAAMLPLLRFEPMAIVRGIRNIMYEFIGIEALAMILPFVRRPKHPYRATLLPLVVNTTILLMIMVVTVGIFGIEPIKQLQYPGASVLRVVRFPGLLIERVGSFVALSWTLLGLMFLSVRFWTVPTGMAQMFGLKARDSNYFLLPMGLLTFLLARMPLNPDQLETFTQGFLVPMSFWVSVTLPILLLAVARIRRLGARP